MTIKLISRIDSVLAAPDLWAQQYMGTQNPRHIEITKDLRAMQDSGGVTIEAVNLIIGNTSWTSFACSECGNDFDYLVRIGDTPDYGNRWVDICKGCAAQALGLFPEEGDKL